MRTMLTILLGVILLGSALTVPAQNAGDKTKEQKDNTTVNTEQKTGQNDDNKSDSEVKTSPEKGKTYGGKVYGSARLYVEANDLLKFNSRYYGKVVHVYAYFLSRPSELQIVFEDYKKNQIMLFLSRSNLYNLPNLYKDKLYEIRAKVGKVREGRIHLRFVELNPTFVERNIQDQQIQ